MASAPFKRTVTDVPAASAANGAKWAIYIVEAETVLDGVFI
jgi:hypothetical protein